MALSGNLSTSAYTRSDGTTRTVVFAWSAKQDQLNNTSEISWELKGGGTATGDRYVQVSELVVKVDGVQIYHRDESVHTKCYYGTVLDNGTFTLQHSTDGHKQFTVYVGAGIYDWAINKTGEATFTLNDIPRASDIGATDADIGSATSIVVTRKASAYTHSVKYVFERLSGYITANGGTSQTEVKMTATSIAFMVPEAFYAQIPNKQSGTCTLICTTYSGNTQIGSSQSTTFKVTASRTSSAPLIGGEILDVSELTTKLTRDPSKLIRYFSNAQCTITAQARNSATIVTKSIAGVEVEGDTRIIAGIETNRVVFSTTDSRGYTATAAVTRTLIPYIKLTVNAQLQRVDPTSGDAILTIWGDYYNSGFGAAQNALTVKYRVAQAYGAYGEYQEVTAVVEGNTYTAEVALSGLNYNYAYNAQVTVLDKLMQVSKVAPVSRGIPEFDWGETDFRFNIPVCIPATMYGSEPPSGAKKGQLFFRKNTDGTYAIVIFNGTSWS